MHLVVPGEGRACRSAKPVGGSDAVLRTAVPGHDKEAEGSSAVCEKAHHAWPERAILPSDGGRSTAMLAEIFILRLEALLRVAATGQTTTASDVRFVPVKLPPQSKPERTA